MFETLKQRWRHPPARETPAGPRQGAGPAGVAMRAPIGELRVSNGLKQFFWDLDDRPHAAVLDLGPVWQSTVQLLAGLGCKIYSEDLLRALEQARMQRSQVPLAERFMADNIRYEPESLDGVLVWDILDYVPEELVTPLVVRFHEVLRPGGVVLAFFHNRPEESFRFRRYRITARETVEMIDAPGGWKPQRIFQNRTLLNLFAAFRSSKTFLSRENLREAVFVK